jgi:hypothetical protein
MQETGRWWRNRWEAAGWILFAALLVGFCPLVLYRTTQSTSTDFGEFYRSAQQIWHSGARAPDSKFSHYVPSVDVAAGLVAWMPVSWAAVAWFAIMTAAWLCLLAAVRRYLLADYDATLARQSVLLAGLLMMPLFLDHLCVGAFHVLMVWFLVAGLGRISQNRPWSGGLMLGLAVWIKLLPLLAVGYLLLKRKWLPAGLAVAAAVSIDLALSLAAFGPATAWQLHRQWWHDEACGAKNRMLTDPNPLDADRVNNQSAMIVMRHLLTHMGWGTDADRDEAARRGVTVMPWEVGSVDFGGFRPNVSIADLTAGQLQAAYAAVMMLLALGIVIYCRRPGRELLPVQWSTEIALVVLATLWFSPFVWSYHELAALPALAVIFAQAPRYSRVAVATVVVWLASIALMGSDTARTLGVTLWMNLLLGVVLVATAKAPAGAADDTSEPTPAPA